MSARLLQFFPATQVQEEGYRRFTTFERAVFYIIVFAALFDFRTDRTSISPFQILIAFCIVSGATYFWLRPKDRAPERRLQTLTLIYAGLIVSLCLSYLIAPILHDGQARLMTFARLMYPYSLVLIALATCQSLYRMRIDPKEIMQAAIFLIVLLVLRSTAQAALTSETQSVSAIIKPGFVFAYAIAASVFEPRIKPLAMVMLAIVLGSSFLVLIRSTWILFAVILLAGVTVAAVFNGRNWFAYLWRFLPATLTFLIAVVGFLSYTIVSNPDQVDRWRNRLFPDNEFTLRTDSVLIRYSLIRGMAEDLGDDPLLWLVGKGAGTQFFASDYYEAERRRITRTQPHDDTDIAFMNIVHRGGIISSLLYITFHLAALWWCFAALLAGKRFGLIHLSSYGIGFLLVLAVIMEQFVNNIFHGRVMSLIFGLVVGGTLCLYAALRDGHTPYEESKDAKAMPPGATDRQLTVGSK